LELDRVNNIFSGDHMKIAILNGDMQSEGAMTIFIGQLSSMLAADHDVTTFNLDDMNLQYCIGCWSCWWKTPGRCTHRDDAEQIYRTVINADFILFASPLMTGFISSALKKITERMIVLIHPYIQIINGESHHHKRYDKYPEFGVLLQKEADTDDEDVTIVSDIYDRLAINFHSRKRFLKFIESSTVEDISHEISYI